MGILGKISDLAKGKADLSTSARSSKWPKVRADYIKINNRCAVCDGTKKLEVHHIHPFHTHPELELESTNFVTLCESNNNGINCHLLVGHLGNYRSVNIKVQEDAEFWNKKLAERPADAKLVV